MEPDLFTFQERTTRLHRGVSTSIDAALAASHNATTDSLFALKTIYEKSGATYKEVNLAAGRDIQPRVSVLEGDGYIEPLKDSSGQIVKRERCRVMTITKTGYDLLRGAV